MSKKIPMKLQIFAEPPQPPEQNPANPPQAPEGQQAPAFDYDKLANLIAGTECDGGIRPERVFQTAGTVKRADGTGNYSI